MNTGYKMTMAFIALLMIVGISASATRASRSALAHEADSANIKQQAAADSQKINEGSVVDEVIWVVGDEAILKSDATDALVDRSIDRKLAASLKTAVKLNEKEISVEDFNKMMQE
jgi:hypothetical protein